MLELLLLVVGCYVLAALSVHLAFRIRNKKGQAGKHYVLVANENQQNIEWVIRSLFDFSRRMGKDVRLTIVDRGVTEETKAIVERMARGGHKVKLHGKADGPLKESKDGKRSHRNEVDATQLMWLLQAEGIVSQADHAVLVDLQNPSDLSKMPF
ncbi:glycosyltransferase family 2 protein [Paenibacillus arenilitoris]|uniref:Glycosyltransferase family 2 protein n=1 Tax=Paenibacillus arenilitoris TaxID=2772299 RepID=A0A927CJ07_9BACL|nr:glycosyltransferase family 2 protein [Paenibacillus arenilitoris]MBD2868404.1 glycosyltransferase family 2 protein [Paenibacillus arenilitoris]